MILSYNFELKHHAHYSYKGVHVMSLNQYMSVIDQSKVGQLIIWSGSENSEKTMLKSENKILKG